VEALKRFDQQNSPRIIELLATYSQEGRYYLLFPAAEGNLRDFWQEVTPSSTREASLWLARESHGLAMGLSQIHRHVFTDEIVRDGQSESKANGSDQDDDPTNEPDNRPRYGLHGDIKPENVLWFKKDSPNSYPHLVISDFGLCKFTSREWRSRIDAINHDGSLTYRAPECDTEIYRGLHYDIWSLGCVFLESITWVLEGWEGVDLFSLKRMNDEKKLRVYNTRSPIPEDKFFVSYKQQVAGHDVGQVQAAVKPAVREVCFNAP
jgi:serine/threonine protein kinase